MVGQVLIEIAFAFGMLIVGAGVWQFQKRKRFLTLAIGDFDILDPLITKENLDNPPKRHLHYLEYQPSLIAIGVLWMADEHSERTRLFLFVIGVVALLTGSYFLGGWYLAINSVLFILTAFVPLWRANKNSAIEHIFLNALILHKWHGENPAKCAEFVDMAFTLHQIYHLVKFAQ